MSTVTERFLRYIAFPTTSAENSDTIPSTAGQKLLGAALAEELAALGLPGAHMDELGYVYATLPATPGCIAPAIGLIAHMDTSPDVSGANIHPRIVHYSGGDLPLKAGEAITLAAFPALANYTGQDLIVTDGTTLLGADDKAGIAEIMTACDTLQLTPRSSTVRLPSASRPTKRSDVASTTLTLANFPLRQPTPWTAENSGRSNMRISTQPRRGLKSRG